MKQPNGAETRSLRARMFENHVDSKCRSSDIRYSDAEAFLIMTCTKLLSIFSVAVAGLLGAPADCFAQPYPNPYRMVDGWAQLPDGRMRGAVGGVTIDPDGKHVWAIVRCDSAEPERFGN